MRPGAEGTPGVDHDRLELRRRVLPRRPDPEATDDDAVMEGAPSVLPAVGDVLHADVEAFAQRALAGIVGVDREAAVELLHALRKQLEQLRELELAPADDDPPQRNALFSLSKKPSSSWRYVFSSACASNSESSRRCSSLRWRGTRTLTSTRWSPRPKPCSTGMPRPRSTRISPGCVPGSNSSSRSPSSVGIVTAVPSAACVTVRSTVA